MFKPRLLSRNNILVIAPKNYGKLQPCTFFEAFSYYNHGQNILRIFDVLPNFLFTTSETKPNY